jgi:uncharacterized protein with HEPN domain
VKDDRLYVDHILECIMDVAEFTREGKYAFFSDKKTQQAVLRTLQTLAESTQRLSRSLKSGHAEVNWVAIAGFRNIVVHDYLGVDLDQVWQIAEKDLPELKRQLETIKGELGDE